MTRLRKDSAALLALSALSAALAFFYFPRAPVWLTDIGVRYIQAANIRFTPGLDLAIEYPGRGIDLALQFIPFASSFHFLHTGRLLFTSSASVPFLSLPLVAAFGPRAGLIVPALAGLACAWMAGRLTRPAASGWEWIAALAAGLGTPLLIYSFGFWEHTLAAALGLSAVILLVESPCLRGYVWSGVMAGLAAAARKQLYLFVIALAVALAVDCLARRDRRQAGREGLGWIAAVSCVTFLAWMINFTQTGRIVPPEIAISVSFALSPQSYLIERGIGGLSEFLFDASYGALGGWLTATAMVYVAAAWLPGERPRTLAQVTALTATGLGVWQFMSARLDTPELHGLLASCPMLLLGAGTKIGSSRPSRLLGLTAVVFLALAVISLGLLTVRGPAQGQGEWGPRYLLVLFPLWVPLMVTRLSELWGQAGRSWMARLHFVLALQVIGLSIFIQGLGLTVMRAASLANHQRSVALLALPERQLVTTEAWLAPIAPEVYLSKEVFLVGGPEAAGEWLARASAGGVSEFVFVTAAEKGVFSAGESGLTVVDQYKLVNDFLYVTRYRID